MNMILEGMPIYKTGEVSIDKVITLRFEDIEKAAANFEGLNLSNPEIGRNVTFRKLSVGVVVNSNGEYKCSCCTESFPFDKRKPYSYCPRCGAALYKKMVWDGKSTFVEANKILVIQNVKDGGIDLYKIQKDLRNVFNETSAKAMEDVSSAWWKAVDELIDGLGAVAIKEDPS